MSDTTTENYQLYVEMVSFFIISDTLPQIEVIMQDDWMSNTSNVFVFNNIEVTLRYAERHDSFYWWVTDYKPGKISFYSPAIQSVTAQPAVIDQDKIDQENTQRRVNNLAATLECIAPGHMSVVATKITAKGMATEFGRLAELLV